ncbi:MULTISPECIES: hypothetical protein [unclassified Novosphingobium]|uniref:hypothetical protein n=1 Tax=unclassified Novosphingobium TaxID=2644732 RepID=UPI001F36F078|nr:MULTISPECIES: hypothetical protein [unclassified Novosphingobium]
MPQRDLFGGLPGDPGETLPGPRGWDEVISAGKEAQLIARIAGCDFRPLRFQGWLGKRLTCSFGWSYDFDHGEFQRRCNCRTAGN